MKRQVRYRGWLVLSLASLACGAGEDENGDPSVTRRATSTDTPSDTADETESGAGDTPARAPELAGCDRGTLEPDLMAQPLAGATVTDGALPPGQYVLSTTYLQLSQEDASRQLFQDLLAPVLGDLQTRPGLVAIALGTSASCGVARTLAVWQDEASMYGFVTGSAHAAAMARVGDISRGGSMVTHWLGDETSANWARAAEQMGADEGQLY